MGKKKKKNVFNPVLKDKKLLKKAPPERSPTPGPAVLRDETPEEENLFWEAMRNVKPLSGRETRTPANPRARTCPAHPPPNEDQEVVEHLQGLVDGSIQMDITLTDEYMEGALPGVGKKVLKALKRGQFPVQDYLDLHGLTRQEAEERVAEFLVRSHRLGRRCVLIVHGRGLNSPASFPVLKESLPEWFTRGAPRKLILAFTTARPHDGGAGAVYVLLRAH